MRNCVFSPFMKWFLPALLWLTAQQTVAQNTAVISGKLTDEKGRPAAYITIVLQEEQQFNTTSGEDGRYALSIPADKPFTVVFSALNVEPFRKTVNVKSADTLRLNVMLNTKLQALREVVVKTENLREKASTTEIEVKGTTLPSVNEGIEAYLMAQGLGVQKSNELSSNYSVRGGNFDENLVYVNDFEVYRPFLIRSGQQEGLSFVNPNLVSRVKFTSGGFASNYGDKMSSVLDVTYKRPKKFAGSISGSLLGVAAHLEGCDKSGRFTFLLGVRQRLSQYVLRSLEEKGQYSPNFLDVQALMNYQINEKWSIEYLANFARNRFEFKPENRETTFGLLNDVKRLNIYYEGQESDRYLSLMNGLSFSYAHNENLRFKWLGAVYLNEELERFDMLSED